MQHIQEHEKQAKRQSLVDNMLDNEQIATELQHEINPDRRDEHEVEHKLLHLLKQRVQDTKQSEEYKTAAEAQSAYYTGVIENLRSDLERELSVIQHQEQDKAVLEKQIQIARDIIERLKTDLQQETKRRDEEIERQRLKYKGDQDRINAEFKTATDFCNDLHRKLEAETKHRNALAQKTNTLAAEIETYQKKIETDSARVRQLEKTLQEEKHQLALTKQEKHRDQETNKATLSTLEQTLKQTNDKIIIVQNKGAEERAKQLQQFEKEKADTIAKYEQRIKDLKHAAEVDHKKHQEDKQAQLQLIEDLKIKDSDDVTRERTKASAEIKRLTTDHEHEMSRLAAQITDIASQRDNGDALLRILKGEYDQEKVKVERLNEEVATLEETLRMTRSDQAKLNARIAQFSKELELERESLKTKLDLERESIKQQYDVEQKELVNKHKQNSDKLTRELESQKSAAIESERRLDETKTELVRRITELERERTDINRRMKAAEQLAKSKEAVLKETTKQQEASNKRSRELSESLAAEQQRTAQLTARLSEQVEITQKTYADRVDYGKKMEAEVNKARSIISNLKPQYDTERERNAELLNEWRAEKTKMNSQVESLNETLAAERARLEAEKGKVATYQTQLRQLDNRNDALQRDVQHNEEVREVKSTKEVHTTQVKHVETN